MEQQFNTRAYNTIELLPFGLVRKSSSSDRLRDEVFYYESIPSDIVHLFPRKTDYYQENEKHHLILEYYPYKNLGQYMISNDRFDWIAAFKNLKESMQLMSHHVQPSEDSVNHAVSMYITKTYTEYLNLKKSFHDTELFSSDKLVINGKEYDNFETIWDTVKSLIEKHLMSYERTMIHGDMCFSNILYHPEVGARFIDMRGSFGARGVYGDRIYDYAKLLHSVEGGYEFFINDCFVVEKQSTGVYNAQVFCNKNKDDALAAYMSAFSDKNIDLIRLVEGLIFVSMCARHYDSEKRQMMMYLTGIRNLNEAVKELC
jgi:hypothetical protein